MWSQQREHLKILVELGAREESLLLQRQHQHVGMALFVGRMQSVHRVLWASGAWWIPPESPKHVICPYAHTLCCNQAAFPQIIDYHSRVDAASVVSARSMKVKMQRKVKPVYVLLHCILLD